MVKKDPIPKEIFDILACPLCRADLDYNEDKTALICVKCGSKYPINKEGIPVLLPPKELKKAKTKKEKEDILFIIKHIEENLKNPNSMYKADDVKKAFRTLKK